MSGFARADRGGRADERGAAEGGGVGGVGLVARLLPFRRLEAFISLPRPPVQR